MSDNTCIISNCEYLIKEGGRGMSKDLKVVSAFIAPDNARWKGELMIVTDDGRVFYEQCGAWLPFMFSLSQSLEGLAEGEPVADCDHLTTNREASRNKCDE